MFGSLVDFRELKWAWAVVGILSTVLGVDLWRRKYTNRKDVHKLYGYPILGSAMDFLSDNMLNTLVEFPRKYGKVVQFYLLSQRAWLFTDRDMINEILRRRPKAFRRGPIDHVTEVLHLEAGLFTANEHWSRVRKATAPSFNLQNIVNKFPSLVKLTVAFVNQLKKQQSKETHKPIELLMEIMNYTKSVITVVGMGVEPDVKVCEYFFTPQSMKDLSSILHFFLQVAVYPFPRWTWAYSPFYKYERIAREANIRFDAATRKLLAYKRQVYEETSTRNHAMLDSLLAKEPNTHHHHSSSSNNNNNDSEEKMLSDDELVANIKTFYTAGSDTTAVTLAWTCYYFALYPQVCQQVREELDQQILQGRRLEDVPPTEMTVEQIKGLTYCTIVVKEVIRLKAPASFLIHQLQEDVPSVTLANGIEILQSDVIFTNVDGMLVHPDVYENPLEFQPTRWLTTEAEKLKVMEDYFVAFGGGARVCPGMQLAYLEAILAAAMLAYSFDMSLGCRKEEIVRIQALTVGPNCMPMVLNPVIR